MMVLRPRQGNLRFIFRLFKSYARQASLKTKNKPEISFVSASTVDNPIKDAINLLKKIRLDVSHESSA